jgi:hypothetical protein
MEALICIGVVLALVGVGLVSALSKPAPQTNPFYEYAAFYLQPPTKPDVWIAMKINEGNGWLLVRTEPYGYAVKVTMARDKTKQNR